MSSQGRRKSKTSSPKSFQSHKLRARQDARQAHSLLKNLHFFFLGCTQSLKESPAEEGMEKQRPDFTRLCWIGAPRGVPGTWGWQEEGESETPQPLLGGFPAPAQSQHPPVELEKQGKRGGGFFWFVFFIFLFFSISPASSISHCAVGLESTLGFQGIHSSCLIPGQRSSFSQEL